MDLFAVKNGKSQPKNDYQKSLQYWANIRPDINGMLGGFDRISLTDMNGSREFLNALRKARYLLDAHYALDCGAGIGRITKGLLLPLFERVDMVDANSSFLTAAQSFIGENDWKRVGKCFNQSLATFTPSSHQYNCIWIQWVIGYLSDDDLALFLSRCKNSLKEGGCIIVKDNISSAETSEFDSADSSITRTKEQLLEIFARASLNIVGDKKQLYFPKELYEVRMFALKPQAN